MIQKDIFISYARKDYVDNNNCIIPTSIVARIQDALTKAGISYWIDEEGLQAGDDFAQKIAKQIEACKIVIFISSQHSNQSVWVQNEIATAHLLGKTIIPFRVDNTPFNTGILIYIASLQYIDYYAKPDSAIDSLVQACQLVIGQTATPLPTAKNKGNTKLVWKRTATLVLTLVVVLVLGAIIYTKRANIYEYINKCFPAPKSEISPGDTVIIDTFTINNVLPPTAPLDIQEDNAQVYPSCSIFISNKHQYAYYTTADACSRVVTYQYEGKNIQVELSSMGVGMCPKLIQQHRASYLAYEDPTSTMALNEEDRQEYICTQHDFDSDNVDEIVIVSRIVSEKPSPMGVYVYRIKDEQSWHFVAKNTQSHMSVTLDSVHIKILPTWGDDIYHWAYENGEFANYGSYIDEL